MSDELGDILISHLESDFSDKLDRLRSKTCEMATFNPRSDEGKKVAEIIDDVRDRHDEAIRERTKEFDGVDLKPDEFRVPKRDLVEAYDQLASDNAKLLSSIQRAIENVRRYQSEIFIGTRRHPGMKYTPIKSVGICVPGASAPLPSTVIMTGVPAQVAGVERIAVVSPPRFKGTIHPVILAVCHALGIEEVYRIGGVQAVAALADGTEHIPSVDKIVGPGNMWVQTAKRILFGQVGIDSTAGPSEVLVLANDQAIPAWIAADMLSQAEHDPGSAMLFTDSRELAIAVLNELKHQVQQLSRSARTVRCLSEYSRIAVFGDMDEVIHWANAFAAEHVQIQCGENSRQIADQITTAGAIFIGPYTPVAAGDYWAGPSHTLPTGGGARFSSALTSNDFVKSISLIEYSADQLAAAADDIIRLAETEGLDAHARSVDIRRQK
ncbi:MAG: histidinol dehydrogenase [Planctomycetes bacterium]|nr:histidinol dehydrogenase [Planctomycetota bacterium]